MEYINNTDFKIDSETVVTFGKFDGLHNGHKLLIAKAVEIAKNEKLKMVLCTFDMSGWKQNCNPCITDNLEKKKLCERLGVDILIDYPFDDRTAKLNPEEFIEQVMKTKLNAKYVVVGADWKFGSNRCGNVNLLRGLQETYGYKSIILDKLLYNNREISSTWIRNEIIEGNMENCKKLLGYPFFFFGRVKHGKKLGRTIGFPTINLIPEKDKILPKFGVYETQVHINGKIYKGVTNVGIRPTLDDGEMPTVETFVIDFDGDVYDWEVLVELIRFIRPEMKFESVDLLQKQMQKDILTVRKNTCY